MVASLHCKDTASVLLFHCLPHAGIYLGYATAFLLRRPDVSLFHRRRLRRRFHRRANHPPPLKVSKLRHYRRTKRPQTKYRRCGELRRL
ncbi:hypothetical protein L1987_79220 [Smallanthus sonchifolius]|uniref:Uncharacterized protein n=1 Tax=Smallanthus sonchifolius TaxID=185202 RepID=A0ACB8ZFW0_9ASTR|nr:hypothetical protein L1987_79220 [Smallanthus sonchifolius]